MAVELIQVSQGGFDTHQYINQMNKGNGSLFLGMVEQYRTNFVLPENTSAAATEVNP